MKYAIIIPTLTVGGAEKIAIDTAIGIHEKNHDVTIIVLSNKIDLNVPKAIRIISITNNKLLTLIGCLKREKFDGCISYMERANLLSVLACSMTRTKFCASVHTAPKAGFAQRKLLNKIVIKFIYKLIKLFNARVICVCDGIKKDLNHLYGIQNSVVIPNFINQAELFNKACETGSEDKKYDFIFVGRLSKVKGCDVLIDALVSNKEIIIKNDIKTVIIGEGPERSELENKIINANLCNNVQFLGKLNNPYPYMKGSKYLVVPSYAEGFGLVVLEGLSLGCDVIYSHCDFGPSEIISNHFPEMSELHITDPSENRNAAVDDLKLIISKLILSGYITPVSHDEVQRRINAYYNRSLVCDDIIKSLN